MRGYIKRIICVPFYCAFSSAMSVTKPKVVFVLGGPGAGKGTQCQNIVRDFGFVHLSAGDLLREERSKGSEFSELIETHIRNGSIVPVEITCQLLKNAMDQSKSKKFLIDGFPRNQNNVDGWNQVMGNSVDLVLVLFFDCPEDVCIQRCIKRGEAGSGRSDDNIESLRKRIVTFKNDSMPIIKFYDDKNLVKKVDGSKNPEEVFNEIKDIFATF